jgi:hypothetical protein
MVLPQKYGTLMTHLAESKFHRWGPEIFPFFKCQHAGIGTLVALLDVKIANFQKIKNMQRTKSLKR